MHNCWLLFRHIVTFFVFLRFTNSLHVRIYTAFHKKTVPFVISLYLYFYKAEFHENPHEYTRGIGHYEQKINFRDSLTILCQCQYNEGTTKCQENKHKTRFILMQTSVYANRNWAKITIYCQNCSTLVFNNKCSQSPSFAETSSKARRRWSHCLTALPITRWSMHSHSSVMRCHNSSRFKSPDILSVDTFLEHAPYTIVYWI